jgi:hypothetical protein
MPSFRPMEIMYQVWPFSRLFYLFFFKFLIL